MPKYGSNDMSFPLDDVLNSITEKTKLVVICNPNNPTGTLISVADIEKICKKAKDAIVYVDEAYAEFSAVTAVPLLDKYPNLIITRTFSKAFGLVALRIGYVIARPELIKEMLKVRGPYDINMVSLCAAKTALQNLDNLDNYVDEVMEKSKPMLEKFLDDVDIRYYESGSNFILIKPKDSKKGEDHKVMKFNILQASVRAYQRNLNTHSTYKDFRKARAEFRDTNKSLDSMELSKYLNKYAQTGNQYVEVLQKIIKQNKLQDFDDAKLLPSSGDLESLI